MRHKLVYFTAFNDAMRGFEAIGKGVHPTDVGVEKVGGFMRFATALRVKVQAACGEATHFENAQHDVGRKVKVARKLIGVPAEERVATIGIDGAKRVCGDGDFHFVFHGVAGQRGVVGLEVELEVTEQIVLAQKVEASSGVGIVLVRGRFSGLWLDVKLSRKSDLFGMVHREMKQRSQVIQFALHVGVEEGSVTFPATPKYITLSTKVMRSLKRVFHLGGRICVDVRRGRSSSALRVARVSKETCRAPKEFFACLFLLSFKGAHYAVQVLVRFAQSRAFRRDISVVEAVVRNGGFLQKFKKDGNSIERILQRLSVVVPWHQGCGGAEGVGEPVAHDMPVRGGEAKVFRHGFVAHFFLGVVVPERKRIVAR